MTNTINGMDGAQQLLMKLVEQNPEDWGTRKKVVQVLYDAGMYKEASKMVWNAPEIPPVGDEVIFAARVVSKGQPSRAMRLFDTVIEKNRVHPKENLEMAKLLVKAHMPHQAIRFYGAATVLDTDLIDEEFELSLVKADSDAAHWGEFVGDADFPWEGPVKEVAEAESDQQENKQDPYANLLNGATQPVPMKAPLREKPERRNELPNWKVEKKKTSSFSMEALEQEPAKEDPSSPEAKPVQERKNALAEFLSEDDSGQEDQAAPAAAEVMDPKAKHKPGVEDTSPKSAEHDEKPAGPNGSTGLPSVGEPSEENSGSSQGSAFFKSYSDAHEHQADAHVAVSEPAAADKDDGSEQPSLSMEINGAATGQAGQPEPEGGSVASVVSDAMTPPEETPDGVDGQLEESGSEEARGGGKSRKTGVFSSLLGKMLSKPAEEREPVINVDELDLSGVKPADESARSASAGSDEPDAAVPEARETVPQAQLPQQSTEKAPVQPQPPLPSAVKPVQPIEQQQPSVPKELDGRTQLVSLAPEDGTAFFNQLRERYASVQRDALPRPATLARDLANIDYIDLINKACNKDLDAFSKLLGLHRVMHSAGCSEWVDDMNLLRKGYGDAVLATVVSRYSVEECREILSRVYSHPQPRAAAV